MNGVGGWHWLGWRLGARDRTRALHPPSVPTPLTQPYPTCLPAPPHPPPPRPAPPRTLHCRATPCSGCSTPTPGCAATRAAPRAPPPCRCAGGGRGFGAPSNSGSHQLGSSHQEAVGRSCIDGFSQSEPITMDHTQPSLPAERQAVGGAHPRPRAGRPRRRGGGRAQRVRGASAEAGRSSAAPAGGADTVTLRTCPRLHAHSHHAALLCTPPLFPACLALAQQRHRVCVSPPGQHGVGPPADAELVRKPGSQVSA